MKFLVLKWWSSSEKCKPIGTTLSIVQQEFTHKHCTLHAWNLWYVLAWPSPKWETALACRKFIRKEECGREAGASAARAEGVKRGRRGTQHNAEPLSSLSRGRLKTRFPGDKKRSCRYRLTSIPIGQGRPGDHHLYRPLPMFLRTRQRRAWRAPRPRVTAASHKPVRSASDWGGGGGSWRTRQRYPSQYFRADRHGGT